jgi:predicted nucleic acid-binding protein
MIAATSLSNDLPIYTANPDDFADIGGLVVVPVEMPTNVGRPAST